MKNNLKILTSHWFLIGLTILLLNDFIFKEMYGNWLTGKLSDFAGLFIFPLFWAALFPKNKNKIFLFTALFFVFWKSPYSQSLLESWNNYMFLKIDRVVDYSDLIALLVLPLAYIYENKREVVKRIRLNPAFPFMLALFSFVATSLPFESVEAEKEYNFNFPLDTLKNRVYKVAVTNMYLMQNAYNDSTSVHPFNIDTFTNENHLTQENMVQDTMNLSVREDFCLKGYSAEIILSGDTKNSNLKLTGFYYRCRKRDANKSPLTGKDVKEKLLNSFENKVIRKLENK